MFFSNGIRLFFITFLMFLAFLFTFPTAAFSSSLSLLDEIERALAERNAISKADSFALAEVDLQEELLNKENASKVRWQSGLEAQLTLFNQDRPRPSQPEWPLGDSSVRLIQTHTITGTLPLYDFGKQFSEQKVLEKKRQEARFNAKLLAEKERAEAHRLLYEIKRSRAKMSSLEEIRAGARRRLEILNAAFLRGDRPQTDAWQAQASVEKVEGQWRKSEKESLLAWQRAVRKTLLPPVKFESTAPLVAPFSQLQILYTALSKSQKEETGFAQELQWQQWESQNLHCAKR
jgi:hypothetical protein